MQKRHDGLCHRWRGQLRVLDPGSGSRAPRVPVRAYGRRLSRASAPRGRIRLRAQCAFDHLACARFRGGTISTCRQSQLTWTIQAAPGSAWCNAPKPHCIVQRVGVGSWLRSRHLKLTLDWHHASRKTDWMVVSFLVLVSMSLRGFHRSSPLPRLSGRGC